MSFPVRSLVETRQVLTRGCPRRLLVRSEVTLGLGIAPTRSAAMSRPRPVWPEQLIWPRLSEACGSLGHAHAHVHAHVWGMVYVKDAFGGPAEPPSSLSLYLSLSLSLDTGLSGLPAEVLKSIEGMTLLEARRRVAP